VTDKDIERVGLFVMFWEKRPATASISWNNDFYWRDGEWLHNRKKFQSLNSPFSIYEVHLGSWMRPDPNDRESFNNYNQIKERLVPYVKGMGFTHVELMPVMEHPRSEEHTSELQSRENIVCRLLLEKKNKR